MAGISPLPDADAVGPLPQVSPRNLPVGQFDSSPIARGAQQLGQGVENLGSGIAGVGAEEQRANNDLLHAQAQSNYAVAHANTMSQAELEPDPTKVGAYKATNQSNLNTAAQMIPEGRQRDRFIAINAPNVAQANATLDTRIKSLSDNQLVATTLQNGNDAMNTATKMQDPVARAALVDAYGPQVDALVAKGTVTPEVGLRMKQEHAQNWVRVRSATDDPRQVARDLEISIYGKPQGDIPMDGGAAVPMTGAPAQGATMPEAGTIGATGAAPTPTQPQTAVDLNKPGVEISTDRGVAAKTGPGAPAPASTADLPLKPTSPGQPIMAKGAAGGVGDAAVLIRHFENPQGPWLDAHWDRDHWRTGYSSDTTTDANGVVHTVTSQTQVTPADAERDLYRRVAQAQNDIQTSIGADAWNKVGPAAQASMSSVAYNYGHLPPPVIAAARTGDPAAVAQAIARLGSNAARRGQEAANITGGFTLKGPGQVAPGSTPTMVMPAPGMVGEPVSPFSAAQPITAPPAPLPSALPVSGGGTPAAAAAEPAPATSNGGAPSALPGARAGAVPTPPERPADLEGNNLPQPANSNTPPAGQSRQRTGSIYDVLPPAEKAQLYRETLNKIRQQDREDRQQIKLASSEALSNIKGVNDTVTQGLSVSDQTWNQMKTAYGTIPNPQVQQALATVDAIRNRLASYRGMAPTAVEQDVYAQRAALGQNPQSDSLASQVFGASQNYLKSYRSQLASAPLERAMSDGVIPPIAPLDPSSPTFAADLRARAVQADHVAQFYGQTPQYLTQEERALFKGVNSQGGPQAIQTAAGVVNGMGPKAGKFFSEIGGDAPALAQIGRMQLQGADPQAISDYAAVQKMAMDKENKTDIPPAPDKALRQNGLNDAYGDAFKGYPEDVNGGTMDAARKLWQAGAIRSSISDPANDIEGVTKAAQKAAGATFVGQTQYGGVGQFKNGWSWLASKMKVPVPSDMDASQFTEAVGKITDADLAKLPNQPMRGPGQPVKASEIQGGYLVGVPDSDGVFRGGYRVYLGDPAGPNSQMVMARNFRDDRPDTMKPFILDLGAFAPVIRARLPGAYKGAM